MPVTKGSRNEQSSVSMVIHDFASSCFFLQQFYQLIFSLVPFSLESVSRPFNFCRSWWSSAPLCLRRRSWPKRTTSSCCSVPSPPGVPPTTCPGGGVLGRCSPPSPDTASASTWSNTYMVYTNVYSMCRTSVCVCGFISYSHKVSTCVPDGLVVVRQGLLVYMLL